MAKKLPQWYWDACVFVAWLNAEDELWGPAVMNGILEMVKDLDNGRCVIFTSVMTKTEIRHRLRSQWAKDEYDHFCMRPNVTVVNQDERIGDKSSDIREHFAQKGVTLDAGDCVHLATAVLYKADTFYTLDGLAEHPKPNALLKLDGDVAGYPLRVMKPHAAQGSLFSGIPSPAVSNAVKPPRLKVVASNPSKLSEK